MAARVIPARGATPGPPKDKWGLLAYRLEPPPIRPTDIRRRAIEERLERSTSRMVAISAPAGYGKTTLLVQMAASAARPVAWLSLDDDDDDDDDDAFTLARYLAVALDGIVPVSPELIDELDSPQPRPRAVLARLGASVRRSEDPFSLVIDDAHALRDRHAIAQVTTILNEMPSGSQVVLASRFGGGFPLAKLRASGDLLEIGVDELRFDSEGAAALLRSAGAVVPDADDVAALTEQTEGWAVSLYLAGRSWSSREPEQVGAPYRGDDRSVADYMRATMLDHLAPDELDFLVRSSVLDELTGSLCDAALQTTGSGAHLEALELSNLLVVPLDRRRERYRYHRLLRDLLRTELDHRSPDLRAPIAARASLWYEENGASDMAVAYAMASGDVDRVATLIGRYAQPSYFSGRAESVRTWCRWFGEHAELERYPAVAVLGALLMALDGRSLEAERWVSASETASRSQDPEVEGSLYLVKAMLCRDGVETMLGDARTALSVIGESSNWRTAALVLEGLGLLACGDRVPAVERFRRAAEESVVRGIAVGGSIAHAQLAQTAIVANRLEEAAWHVDRARTIIEDAGLHGYSTSIPTYAAAARSSLLRGDPVRARTWMDRAMTTEPRLTYAFPVLAVQTAVSLARSAMGLGDPETAEVLLIEAESIVRDRPLLGSQIDELAATREDLAALAAVTTGLPKLTPAEARLLPLLTTHLSFREIGEQLFVSPHTVKTQAISIYRRLGVSSRGAAVDAARRIGLLTN